MNPSSINTKVIKLIDQWHFNVAHDGGKCLAFDITMHRPRDVEDEGFEFTFVATLSKQEPKRGRRLYRAHVPFASLASDSLAGLLQQCTEMAAALTADEWEKVIAVVGNKAGADYGDDDKPLSFEWSVGYRSKDHKWFRRTLVDCYMDNRAGYLLQGGNKEVVVHLWTPELEAALNEIDTRFEKFGDALQHLIKAPEQLVKAAIQLLPPPTK